MIDDYGMGSVPFTDTPDGSAAGSESEQQRKADNLRWLEAHCSWRPFGGEW